MRCCLTWLFGNAAECGSWMIEWGPSSPRPGYFMVYRRSGVNDEYIGTYLTLSAAIRGARMLEGRLRSWGRYECGRGLQTEIHAGGLLGE